MSYKTKKKFNKIVLTCGMIMLTSLIGLPHNIPAPTQFVPKDVVESTIASEILDVFGPMTAYAAEASYSQYWYQDSAGNWKIKDGNGNTVTNAWVCDDAIQSNGQNVWYLLDANGNMITSGLVQDGTGNYYSLETNHNGYFGMLRYQSGNYDGVYLDFESSHNGSFAKIKNADGIEALKAKYGVTSVAHINNNNCVYTSSFKNNIGTTSSPGNSITQNSGSGQVTSSKYTDMSFSQIEDLACSGDQEAKAEYYRRLEGKGTGVSGFSHKKQDRVWKDVILH